MTNIKSYSTAVRGWASAAAGVEPTRSVLESGREIPQAERPMGALLALDVTSGKSRLVADGNIRQLLLSPTRRHLALIAEIGRAPPRPTRRLPYESRFFDLRRTRLAILPLGTQSKAQWVDGVPDPKLPALHLPHSWSPDGTTLAVVAKGTRDDETAEKLFLVSAASGTAHQVTKLHQPVSATSWSSDGKLLALARPDSDSEGDTTRSDWWIVDPLKADEARKITSQLEAVPMALVRTPTRSTMLGVASEDLWSIDIRRGSARNLTNLVDHPVRAILWPAESQRAVGSDGTLIVEAGDGEVYRLELTGKATKIWAFPRPAREAKIAAFRPEQKLVAFTVTQSNGTFLWVGDGQSAQFEKRISLNEQLAHIADPKYLLIDYQGIEGDSLKAVLILPFGYEQGKQYPLVADVYPARTLTDKADAALDKQFVSALNLHLLSARGYAVLIPSTPVTLTGPGTDLYIDLPKGVLGAVDKAISLGIADPERLGVMGHSFGGYSVYTLASYTHRFKAAVATAGLSNLVSLYGVFRAPLRYDAYVNEDLFQASLLESGLGMEMREPPWRDLWRYLRNSPYYFVDRITTPLLIAQGDMDYVPIQQSEELFTAMYRLGKKAKFVRYWGEGHVLSSPANIRDLSHQVSDWFDQHLKSAKPQDRPDGDEKPPTRAGRR
jgi:dipeptidyl aminopeptidase/acylaminoacyl peptidase